jgi:SAM-dependent methyltransferase
VTSTLRSLGDQLLALDNRLIRLLGLGYLRLTRDALIHERCLYLVKCAREIGRKRLKVLDVGCGSGMALYYLDRFCRSIVCDYVGIDMKVQRLHERWNFVELSHVLRQVNLDGEWDFGRFDLVWCSEVIEHLCADERLFRQLGAQLGPSGVLIITTPSRPFIERMGRSLPGFDSISSTQDGGHVRMGYELVDFERMADRNGLQVVSHAWLSPCSESYLELRAQDSALQRVRLSLADLKHRPKPFVINGKPSECAESYWSLGVSLTRRSNISGEPDGAPE